MSSRWVILLPVAAVSFLSVSMPSQGSSFSPAEVVNVPPWSTTSGPPPSCPISLPRGAECVDGMVRVTPVNGDLAGVINGVQLACPISGCTIEIPTLSGMARLSSPLLFTSSNVSLVCDTKQPMVLTYSNTSLSPAGYYYGPVDITGSGFKMSGCSFEMSSIPNGVAGIHVFGASHVEISDNVLYSSRPAAPGQLLGIRIEGSSSDVATDVRVTGNTIAVPYIALSTGDYAERGIVFDNNYTYGGYQPFDFNGSACGGSCPNEPDSYGIQYIHNTAMHFLNSGYVESASDVLIRGNSFLYSGSDGFATIRIHQTTTNSALKVIIDSNQFIGNSSTYAGIQIFQNATDWQITNNTFRDLGADGIIIDSTSGTPLDGVISNNIFVDNGQSGDSTYCGIRLHQSEGNNVGLIRISGNQAMDDQVFPTQFYGICSDGGQAPFALVIDSNQLQAVAAIEFPNGCSACQIGTTPESKPVFLVGIGLASIVLTRFLHYARPLAQAAGSSAACRRVLQ